MVVVAVWLVRVVVMVVVVVGLELMILAQMQLS